MSFSTFPVYQIATASARRLETLGGKEKLWVFPTERQGLPLEPHLLKFGRPNTGETWSEKISSELAALVGLPCARYEFAVTEDGTKGVLSCRIGRLILGNLLLALFVRGYDRERTYKQSQYTLENVVQLLERLQGFVPAEREFFGTKINDVELFVGYLVFDAWIGNTDRHHENWGLLVDSDGSRLAPTFDHASCLGRELSDEKRGQRLSTADSRNNVAAYAARARSAFFGEDAERTLSMRETLMQLRNNYPRATKFWATRICAIPEDDIRAVFSRVDRGWISAQAEEFALALLRVNSDMIRETCLVE